MGSQGGLLFFFFLVYLSVFGFTWSLLLCKGFSRCGEQEVLISVASLVAEHRLQGQAASSCSLHVLQFLVTRCLVRSSQTRDQTHVFCITRWILNHQITRVLLSYIYNFIAVQLIYSTVLSFSVQQSDPVIHTHIFIIFQILFSHMSLQNTQQSFLCYTLGIYLIYSSMCIFLPSF